MTQQRRMFMHLSGGASDTNTATNKVVRINLLGFSEEGSGI
jgi:hypothetical protein